MSRKAFIGDTLKYRKPRSKPDCMTTLQVMYDHASQISDISSPYKGVEGCLPCLFLQHLVFLNIYPFEMKKILLFKYAPQKTFTLFIYACMQA